MNRYWRPVVALMICSSGVGGVWAQERETATSQEAEPVVKAKEDFEPPETTPPEPPKPKPPKRMAKTKAKQQTGGMTELQYIHLQRAGKYLKSYRKVHYGGLALAVVGMVAYISAFDTSGVVKPGRANTGFLLLLGGMGVMSAGPYYIGKAGEALENVSLAAGVGPRKYGVRVGYRVKGKKQE